MNYENWEYVNTGDCAVVLMGKEANMLTGKDVLFMNNDHETAKLIAEGPDIKEALQNIISALDQSSGEVMMPSSLMRAILNAKQLIS